MHFNPRPREEGDKPNSYYNAYATNFNPRPREEGDNYDDIQVSKYIISIHALVKRATSLKCDLHTRTVISIHALVKRATVIKMRPTHTHSYFNPRPREEGDPYNCGLMSYPFIISIHALVKRATAELAEYKQKFTISIHALVKRATDNSKEVKVDTSISIHALVKRATYSVCYHNDNNIYFNPRPREEGDLVSLSIL